MNNSKNQMTLDASGCEYLLDARGLLCPEPVMLLHKKIRSANAGEKIKVLATDPSTERDITRFCDFLRHELIAMSTLDDTYIYLIKKREDIES